ncbi:MAG: hypothetical protein ABIA37_01100 [Candidatus Woesearchaeota archaeon]
MKIGIDIDEVLADFVNPFLDYYNWGYETSFCREQIISYNFWEVLPTAKEETYHLVRDFHNTDSFKNLPLIDGSQEAVSRLEQDHNLFVITSRSYSLVGKATEDWLEQHFPQKFSQVYFTGSWSDQPDKSKHQLCSELGLDLMIEDNLDYAKKCSQVTQVYLMDCPWNQGNHLPERIIRVKNWPEIMQSIKNLSRPELRP